MAPPGQDPALFQGKRCNKFCRNVRGGDGVLAIERAIVAETCGATFSRRSSAAGTMSPPLGHGTMSQELSPASGQKAGPTPEGGTADGSAHTSPQSKHGKVDTHHATKQCLTFHNQRTSETLAMAMHGRPSLTRTYSQEKHILNISEELSKMMPPADEDDDSDDDDDIPKSLMHMCKLGSQNPILSRQTSIVQGRGGPGTKLSSRTASISGMPGPPFTPMTAERRRELFEKMQKWAHDFLRSVLAHHKQHMKVRYDQLSSKLEGQEVANLRLDIALLCIHAKTQLSAIKAAYHEMLKKNLKNISGTYISPWSGCVGKSHSVGYVELVFGCLS